MTDRELMQQVLEDICGAKLCEINSMSSRVEMIRLLDNATAALRERLAQPEQEPVAWMSPNKESFVHAEDVGNSVPNWTDYYTIPLYTTPPQRTWVGLTDEDKQTAFDDTQEGGGFWEFADAIEANLQEKNT